jgi:olefin beta-lactone synthetase
MKKGYYEGENIKNNVTSFLEECANQYPNRIAFYFLRPEEDNHRSITYREFNNQSSSLASGLLKSGIKKNDRVIVFASISLELYLSIAALQRIGAIPVLIESFSRLDQFLGIINNSKPHGIIASSLWLEKCQNIFNDIKIKISTDKRCLGVDAIFFDLFSGDYQEIIPLNKDHTALINYTTGSSGLPKGVERTHSFLTAQHYALKKIFPYQEGSIDLPVFPIFTLNNIASGITTVLPATDISNPSDNNPKSLLKQILDCRVNCMTLAPSSFRNLAIYCEELGIYLNNISRVLTGGAPIGEKDIKRFIRIAPKSKTWILYGSTEVEPISYIESQEMISIKIPEQVNKTNMGVNVGIIDEDLHYKIINIETDNVVDSIKVDDIEVSKGGIGELIVAGEHVCQKYYNNEEAFVRTKIKDNTGTIWHRTGDLVRIDDSNHLWIVGRKHNVIKRGEELFFPVRPEIMLKDISNISNAAYLDFQSDDIQKIVAVVALKISSDENRDKCKKEIKEIFKKEGLPLDDIIFFSEIPMDVRHHSKVDYRSLRQKLHDL